MDYQCFCIIILFLSARSTADLACSNDERKRIIGKFPVLLMPALRRTKAIHFSLPKYIYQWVANTFKVSPGFNSESIYLPYFSRYPSQSLVSSEMCLNIIWCTMKIFAKSAKTTFFYDTFNAGIFERRWILSCETFIWLVCIGCILEWSKCGWPSDIFYSHEILFIAWPLLLRMDETFYT